MMLVMAPLQMKITLDGIADTIEHSGALKLMEAQHSIGLAEKSKIDITF